MSRFRIALIAGALVALAACDEAAAPKGIPGDVTVRAYIDRDASGTFNAGDSALAGVEVSAAPSAASDGDVASATTDASGQATFQDLPPGSYTITIASGAPTGAVLTTNPAPTIGVSFQGTVTGSADFRFAFHPGSLSGRIYRDDNGDGDFDAGTDTPGAGFLVTLRANDGGTAGAAVDSVRADATGLWTFPRLAPGTYFVEFENPGTIDYGSEGAVRQVVVAPEGAPSVPAVFTGSLVIPIEQARARAVGSNVEVEGVITVAPGTFTFGTGNVNSEVWVQDATGGIAVVQAPTNATGLAVGQRVSVRGVRSDNALQEQIGSTSASATITPLAGTAPVAPQAVTIGQAVAREGFEGELVTLSGFTVTSVGTGADYTVSGTVDGTAIQLRIESTTGIAPATFTVGTRYVVTGILTQFNAATQIKPRSPADIAGPTPIATVRAGTPNTGTVYTISGIVTSAPGQITISSTNSEIWIQDATGGIAAIYPTANAAGIAIGDAVEVTGTLGAFNGQLQMGSTTTPAQVTRLGAATPVAPLVQTGAQINARAAEGQLVQVAGFTVVTVGGGTGAAFNVTGTAPDGQTVTVRVASAGTGLTRASFVVGSTYTITGILSQFNGTAQIKPRMTSDVVEGIVATPAQVIINEFMANPQTVADNAGEYIELHNAGGTDQDIQGWIISDNFGVDTIDVPLVIPAGGYVVLGVNATTATNGGVQVDFQYTSNIALGNSGDRIQLRDANNVTVDSVAYASNAQAQAGIAVGVVDAAADNTDAGGANWVAQTSVYNTTTVTDRGTPRARNDGATGAAAVRASTQGTTTFLPRGSAAKRR